MIWGWKTFTIAHVYYVFDSLGCFKKLKKKKKKKKKPHYQQQ